MSQIITHACAPAAVVPPLVPTMVRLPGQTRSLVQLLPPPRPAATPRRGVDRGWSAAVPYLRHILITPSQLLTLQDLQR